MYGQRPQTGLLLRPPAMAAAARCHCPACRNHLRLHQTSRPAPSSPVLPPRAPSAQPAMALVPLAELAPRPRPCAGRLAHSDEAPPLERSSPTVLLAVATRGGQIPPRANSRSTTSRARPATPCTTRSAPRAAGSTRSRLRRAPRLRPGPRSSPAVRAPLARRGPRQRVGGRRPDARDSWSPLSSGLCHD